jgi:hypothetical protein
MSFYKGGSFAPPLNDELFDYYEKLASEATPEVNSYIQKLIKCCKVWWSLPESASEANGVHQSGVGAVIPLDTPIANLLWPHIPQDSELRAMDAHFNALTHGPLRNAVFHLRWHVQEFRLGREPITTNKL